MYKTTDHTYEKSKIAIKLQMNTAGKLFIKRVFKIHYANLMTEENAICKYVWYKFHVDHAYKLFSMG